MKALMCLPIAVSLVDSLPARHDLFIAYPIKDVYPWYGPRWSFSCYKNGH